MHSENDKGEVDGVDKVADGKILQNLALHHHNSMIYIQFQ